MKIQNISDVNKFFAVIDQCKGTVELVSPEGDPEIQTDPVPVHGNYLFKRIY